MWQQLKTSSATSFGYVTAGSFFAHGQWRTQDLTKGGGGEHNRVSEGYAPSRQTNFCGFHIKNTHFSTLFIEKGHALRAVTIDDAKIFSQLMARSRSLAKINERRLQPLLV